MSHTATTTATVTPVATPVEALCHYCGGSHAADALVRVIRGRYSSRNGRTHDKLCPGCIAQQTIMCPHCDERVHTRHTRALASGGRVCERCVYMSAYRTCCSCNTCDHAENLTSQEGYYYCASCLLRHANFEFGDFQSNGCTTELRSSRSFGIELETDSCDGYYDELLNHPAWGAKEDCTVSGKEFFSAILSGDAGLNAIDEIAEIAESNSWEVACDCGFHLHLDMRGEKRDSLYAIAYAYRATEKVWLSFVGRSRRNGSYCHTCEWTCADVDNAVAARRGVGSRFRRWSDSQDRYDWVNVQAYGTHTTMEIRLHDGTCDGKAVVNWVKAHTRFADWASKLGYEGVKAALSGLSADEMFTFIAQEIWDDGDLTIYYGTRAKNMEGSYLTTSVGVAASGDEDVTF